MYIYGGTCSHTITVGLQNGDEEPSNTPSNNESGPSSIIVAVVVVMVCITLIILVVIITVILAMYWRFKIKVLRAKYTQFYIDAMLPNIGDVC